ncbi:MAG TPA: DMT family transporter, partial [Methanocellaceae archaeon]
FLVYTYGLKKLRASDVAMSIYVSPLAGILLAIMLMGESLTIFTVAGGALVLAGMLMTQGELKAEPAELKMSRPQEGAKHYTAYNE